MCSVKRYDLSSAHEMIESEDGEWVKYEDIKHRVVPKICIDLNENDTFEEVRTKINEALKEGEKSRESLPAD